MKEFEKWEAQDCATSQCANIVADCDECKNLKKVGKQHWSGR